MVTLCYGALEIVGLLLLLFVRKYDVLIYDLRILVIRYDTIRYIDVRSKAGGCQLKLAHGTETKKIRKN